MENAVPCHSPERYTAHAEHACGFLRRQQKGAARAAAGGDRPAGNQIMERGALALGQR